MFKWKLKDNDVSDVSKLADRFHISQTTATVIANRFKAAGLVCKPSSVQAFLNADLSALHNAWLFEDAEKAVSRLKRAITEREKITIYGDYDVDGITGTAILYKGLSGLIEKQETPENMTDSRLTYYLPHRVEEGYGLNMSAVETIVADGTKLLLCVDNGISAINEVARANELGMDVVIFDHHEPAFDEVVMPKTDKDIRAFSPPNNTADIMNGGSFTAPEQSQRRDVLPSAYAIIDPKKQSCGYPFKNLCAAAIAFKMVAILYENMNISFALHDELVVLSAIATVCDVVDLTDENRIIVKHGLDLLNTQKDINAGLYSLICVRRYVDKPINTFTLGFVLGPCLNATGRLDTAALAVMLLLDQLGDFPDRYTLANRLSQLNDERKALTVQCFEHALSQLPEVLPKVIVLIAADAHESIAGIIAGRIKEATNHPAIVLTPAEGSLKGSGRSIEGYNLFEALLAHKELFIRFGGHAMAAGLSMDEAHVAALAEALNNECSLEDDDFNPVVDVDCALQLEDINLSVAQELERLAPFGKGNDEPQFITENLSIDSVRDISDKNTLIFTFKSQKNPNAAVKGIAFGFNERYKTLGSPTTLTAVYTIEVNVFNGVESVQMRIKNFY